MPLRNALGGLMRHPGGAMVATMQFICVPDGHVCREDPTTHSPCDQYRGVDSRTGVNADQNMLCLLTIRPGIFYSFPY